MTTELSFWQIILPSHVARSSPNSKKSPQEVSARTAAYRAAAQALSPLFASQNWPPTLFNTAFYSNPQVDNALSEALKTTDPQQKTKLYKEAQDIIWKESPWVPLVVEKLVSAHNKALTGFYIMPDTGFSFDDADLK